MPVVESSDGSVVHEFSYGLPIHTYSLQCYIKLGPHDAWFVFGMHHASWFVHRVYEKMCLIWVDVSFVHSSHLVRQLGGTLIHQSKLYVSDLTNLFDTFIHDAPQIRTTHRVDPALLAREQKTHLFLTSIKKILLKPQKYLSKLYITQSLNWTIY